MKKIGIDARVYSQTGVGVYIRNLLYYLDNYYSGNDKFYIYLLESDYNRVVFKNSQFIKKKANFYWHSFSEQTNFLGLLNKESLDLMHFTYFSHPVLYKRPFIATIHDFTPLLFKTGKASTKNPLVYEFKYQVFKYVLKSQIYRSNQIITPTNVIRKQLGDIFGAPSEKKTKTIYEGVDYQLLAAKENIQLKNKFNKKFFIYIGNFYPHKNLERLVNAFAQLDNPDCKLVLIGPNDYFVKSLLDYINIIKQSERIVLYTSGSVSDLVFFYKNAQALIHPSLSEGFGLPLVEAAFFNLPIIASDIPVFKEILSDQYLSFNPNSVKDIQSKINHFISNHSDFNYQPILKKFSFKKMAKETLDCYTDNLS